MFKISKPKPRAASAWAWAASLLLLTACGGGGGGSTAGGPGTGNEPPQAATSYTQGPITGFGSVIVAGVRFDDSTAEVLDDNGGRRSRSDLKLGMVVQLDAGAVDPASATAVARRVRWAHELVGPVGNIDLPGSTVQVLGQTVLVTGNTVFDSTLAGGLQALGSGAVVEVHGILDSANVRIVATRIEPRPGATVFSLRGAVVGLDSSAKTFRIGDALIAYGGLAAADVPSGLADGAIVRVQLQTAQVNGAWVATRLAGGLRLPEGATADARVEGAITALTSTASFVINGLAVNAANASFPDGTAGLVLGARVEVHGAIVDGVLLASVVKIDDGRNPGRHGLELRGDIGGLNAAAKTFVLRGMTVAYDGAVDYRHGSEAQLADGVRVEVRGGLSADRTRLQAQRIDFK